MLATFFANNVWYLSPTHFVINIRPNMDVASRQSCPKFHCPCPQSSVDIQHLTLFGLISAKVFQDFQKKKKFQIRNPQISDFFNPCVGWIPRSQFFPVEIFPKPNKYFDSMKHSESHDLKFSTWFAENPTLEIRLNICYCVGSTYMRGGFLL